VKYNLVIEKISEEYRNKIKECGAIEKSILEINKQLENKSVSHVKFIELQKQKEVKIKEYETSTSIADGISLAREIVFDLN